MLEIGSLIDNKYRVLHQIGKGGMSNVYLAINEKANKQWAVKEVRKDGGRNKEIIRQNLIAETSILVKLRHSNLPSIVDIIKTDDTFLILMDYIEGVTLQQKLDEEGEQPQDDVVKWAIQICGVLEYLHSQDPPIIYRDTKPSNIMLKPDGDVVLIDFGTAREYGDEKDEDTQWLGTKGYAAPEQFGGAGQTDERTDVYNLGATMYHLVTGHNPSRYPYEMYPIRKWNPEYSSGLESIILKCTRKNPEERYQNCRELLADLERYRELDDEYIRDRKKKLRGVCILAALSCVFFVIGGAAAHKAGDLETDHYAEAVRTAQGTAGEAERIRAYRDAIAINPQKADAYAAILSLFLEDGDFSREDAEQMTEILGNAPDGSGTPAEKLLRKNTKGYEDLAYELGIAYFYYYEKEGNKQLSKPWFVIVKNGEAAEANKKARAERFARIAEYHAFLNVRDKAGDSGISYKRYWEDLDALTSGNLVREDNEKTALVMYQELLYQIRMHANEFRKSGVPKKELLDKAAQAKAHLASDFGKLEEADEERRSALLDAAGEAAEAVETAFSE